MGILLDVRISDRPPPEKSTDKSAEVEHAAAASPKSASPKSAVSNKSGAGGGVLVASLLLAHRSTPTWIALPQNSSALTPHAS